MLRYKLKYLVLRLYFMAILYYIYYKVLIILFISYTNEYTKK